MKLQRIVVLAGLVGCVHREELHAHTDVRQVAQLDALQATVVDNTRVRDTTETTVRAPTVVVERWEEPAPDGGVLRHSRTTRTGQVEERKQSEDRVDQHKAIKAEEHQVEQLEQHVQVDKKSETQAGPSWRWVLVFLGVVVAAAALIIWRLRPPWLRFFGL